MTPMTVAGRILADIAPPSGVVLVAGADGIRITGPGSHPVIIDYGATDFADADDVDGYRVRVELAAQRAGGDR